MHLPKARRRRATRRDRGVVAGGLATAGLLALGACGTGTTTAVPATQRQPEPVAVAATVLPSTPGVPTLGGGTGPVTSAPAAGAATSAPVASNAAVTPPSTTTAPRAASPLPALDVTDVASGQPVTLANLLPADRPLLLWMWAPT